MFPPRQVLEPASCRPCCVGYHAVACYVAGYHAAPERLSALRPLRCIEPSAAFGGCAQPMVHRTIKGESHSTGRRCARIRLAAPTRGPRWILGLELKWILCFRCSCTAVRWGMQVTGSVKIAAQLLQVRTRSTEYDFSAVPCSQRHSGSPCRVCPGGLNLPRAPAAPQEG